MQNLGWGGGGSLIFENLPKNWQIFPPPQKKNSKNSKVYTLKKNSQFFFVKKNDKICPKKIKFNNGHDLLVPILPNHKIKTQKFVSMSKKGLRTLPSGYPPKKEGSRSPETLLKCWVTWKQNRSQNAVPTFCWVPQKRVSNVREGLKIRPLR
jgi:hypothetical protein